MNYLILSPTSSSLYSGGRKGGCAARFHVIIIYCALDYLLLGGKKGFPIFDFLAIDPKPININSSIFLFQSSSTDLPRILRRIQIRSQNKQGVNT
jgi:hypothetical protein